MLSSDSYYVKAGKTSQTFNNEVVKDVKKKFNIDNRNLFDIKNNSLIPGYTVYSVLDKEFKFLNKFDKLNTMSFKDSEEKYKYFGINSSSDEILNNNVEILFFESSDEEFAAKLLSENDEVILYKTHSNDSFEKIYSNLLEKQSEYLNKIGQINSAGTFSYIDSIYIPYITINEIINYNELCNKEIENTNLEIIENAYQSIDFTLNEQGVSLKAKSKIKSIKMSAHTDRKELIFNDDFILFIKEKDKEYPYFAVKMNSSKYLEQDIN